MMILKVTEKHSFMLYIDIIFQCILRVNGCIILEWNFNVSTCGINNLLFYFKTKQGYQKLLQKSLGKRY